MWCFKICQALCIVFLWASQEPCEYYSYSYFTNEETQVGRDWVTCPYQPVQEAVFKFRPCWLPWTLTTMPWFTLLCGEAPTIFMHWDGIFRLCLRHTDALAQLCFSVACLFFSRWDIQRIREQRILQRLQLRMYKKKGIQESEPEVTSFFPEPDDGKFHLPIGVGCIKNRVTELQGTACLDLWNT